MSRDSSKGTGAGGELTGHDAVEGELRALEEALLDPEFRRTAQATELLADDFVEFGSSGHAFDKRSVVAALAEERSAERRLSGFRLRLLTPTMALVTYRAHRSSDGAFSLRSSVWHRDECGWRMVFHQGTPCAGIRE